jgi:lipoyl(octanoyl) transferase
MGQTFLRQDAKPVEWAVSAAPVGYAAAVAAMQARAAAIADGRAGELIWLLEHPALYTAGVTAKPADLLTPDRFPVFSSERGGQYTYHGPGQRIAYVMLDLRERGRDVKAFVTSLETWVIAALAALGVAGEIRPGRVGVWVRRGGREDKIAAIGVKMRRWVSYHGVSLNVAPDITSRASCPAASAITESPVWPIWAPPHRWPRPTTPCAALSRRCSEPSSIHPHRLSRTNAHDYRGRRPPPGLASRLKSRSPASCA